MRQILTLKNKNYEHNIKSAARLKPEVMLM